MRIRIGYDIHFSVPAPTPLMLLLHTYPGGYHLLTPEHLVISPDVPVENFSDTFGNTCSRLVAQTGLLKLYNDTVVEVDGMPDKGDLNAQQLEIQNLPTDTLRFLLPSRYCEVDRLTEFAWRQFGSGVTGYQRVQAVCNYVHNHVQFGYLFADSSKSAFDVFNQRRGVCRDFAHLAITLCRCLGIPARYATGYLGDIGVPPNADPMDFSAWFEVFLSNGWYTFDARHNHPRIGRIVMAHGRDAADTALTTSFGLMRLQQFKIWTSEIAA